MSTGWSSEPALDGAYTASFTFFEAGMIPSHQSDRLSQENRKQQVDRRFWFQQNFRASRLSRAHLNDWHFENLTHEKRTWLAAIRYGDKIAIFPRSQHPGWENHVKSLEIKLWCAVE